MGEKEDLLNDLLDDETDNEEEEIDVKSLQDQIGDLEKANQGLLAAKKAETSKRQATAKRLGELENAVSGILSQRQQKGMESLTETEASEARKTGLPVVYDDDGNGWIDQTAVQQLVSPYEQKITDLENKIQQINNTNMAQDEATKVKESIIGENELFSSASRKYGTARKWVEDVVLDFTKENNVKRAMTSGEALDYVFDTETRKEFEKNFDGLDIVDIVTAEDSQDHFRRMLNNIARTMKTDESTNKSESGKIDSRFQKVLSKPSALGNSSNAKAGQLSVIDRIDSLSPQDFMDLTDEQVEALEKAVLQEEKQGGVKW